VTGRGLCCKWVEEVLHCGCIGKGVAMNTNYIIGLVVLVILVILLITLL
jgi:hypothetical protein